VTKIADLVDIASLAKAEPRSASGVLAEPWRVLTLTGPPERLRGHAAADRL